MHLGKRFTLSTFLQISSGSFKKSDGKKTYLNPWVDQEAIHDLKTSKQKKSSIYSAFPKRTVTPHKQIVN